MANKRICINTLLNQIKRDNSISWTPAHTNADKPLPKGNAEADKLAARGCGTHRLETMARSSASPRRSPHITSRAPRPPSRTMPSLRRSRGRRPLPTRMDPRLPPFVRISAYTNQSRVSHSVRMRENSVRVNLILGALI